MVPSQSSGQPPAAPAALPGELSILDSLVQLSFLIQSVLGRLAAERGVSMVQIRLLGVLRDREPGMAELARILDLEKSSVTGLVDRAERRGLVERSAAPGDRRGIRVSLTPRGRELARAFAAEAGREIDVILRGLPGADRTQLAVLASRVVLQYAAAHGIILAT